MIRQFTVNLPLVFSLINNYNGMGFYNRNKWLAAAALAKWRTAGSSFPIVLVIILFLYLHITRLTMESLTIWQPVASKPQKTQENRCCGSPGLVLTWSIRPSITCPSLLSVCYNTSGTVHCRFPLVLTIDCQGTNLPLSQQSSLSELYCLDIREYQMLRQQVMDRSLLSLCVVMSRKGKRPKTWKSLYNPWP